MKSKTHEQNEPNKKKERDPTYLQGQKQSKHKLYYLEVLQNSQSLPRLEKIIRATSASQRTESSQAFLRSPFLRFANVTCLFILFSILFSSTLPLPISSNNYTKALFFNFLSLFVYQNIQSSSLSLFFLFVLLFFFRVPVDPLSLGSVPKYNQIC